MEINLSDAVKAKLSRVAAEQGKKEESLVQEAVERLVDYDDWFMRQVEKGLAEIERNETVKEEEVGARIEKLITERQRRS
jgi:predicted transcriptional regulator